MSCFVYEFDKVAVGVADRTFVVAVARGAGFAQHGMAVGAQPFGEPVDLGAALATEGEVRKPQMLCGVGRRDVGAAHQFQRYAVGEGDEIGLETLGGVFVLFARTAVEIGRVEIPQEFDPPAPECEVVQAHRLTSF